MNQIEEYCDRCTSITCSRQDAYNNGQYNGGGYGQYNNGYDDNNAYQIHEEQNGVFTDLCSDDGGTSWANVYYGMPDGPFCERCHDECNIASNIREVRVKIAGFHLVSH